MVIFNLRQRWSAGAGSLDVGNGRAVAIVPDYGDATVAEHAFALLMAVPRNIFESGVLTRRGGLSIVGVRGLELREKIISVVRTGRIGSRTIEIARGFGMHVAAFDQTHDADAAARLGFSHGALRQAKAVDASDLKALVANHVLLRFPKVLVTPHNASNTGAARRRITKATLANIEGFAASQSVNLVQSG